MAKFELQEADKTDPVAPERIEHVLSVNKAMLIALLKRCGHEVDAKAETRWYQDGVRVRWTTPVI